MFKKTILLIAIILLFNHFNINPISSEDCNSINYFSEIKNNYNNSHFIEDFPYVSQETNFYCTYACPTMIIKYYGINASLKEVLFNSGVGYSLVYSHPKLKRFFLSCIATSNWKSDREFLAEVYGLSYQEKRFYNENYNEKDNWDRYWSEIKKNIFNETPLITIVDPIYLKSIRDCIKNKLNIPDIFIDIIPDKLWNFFPCFTNHMIVIIGFNEDNNTICYNDPSAEVFGYPDLGKYSWMNLTDFRNAMNLLSKNQPYYSYFVGIFSENKNNSLDVLDRFEIAYNRNIERMKGNNSYYDDYITKIWNCTNLGVNGLIKFLNENNGSLNEKMKTINSYKFVSSFYLFTISYRIYQIFDILFPSILNLDDYNSQMNYCYQIAIEKNDISKYLMDIYNSQNFPDISELCYSNSILLKGESENFTRLSENFSKFLGNGILMKKPSALIVLNNMTDIVRNLINLENKLLNSVL